MLEGAQLFVGLIEADIVLNGGVGCYLKYAGGESGPLRRNQTAVVHCSLSQFTTCTFSRIVLFI